MKNIKRVVIFLYIIFILSGCKSNNMGVQDESLKVDLQYQIKKMPYKVYLEKEIELAPYEPVRGAYLGAYVLANPQVEFDIIKFEELVGKNMAVSLRHYQLGGSYPKEWMLHCLAQKKTPYIVVTPESLKNPYNKTILEELALQFKDTYEMPVFMEFYPNPKEFGSPKDYIDYFQLAKEIFAEHAPNIVFVWGIDMDDVYDSIIYYPGDFYVDWIGISMYFPIYRNDEKYNIDIDKRLGYFYNMYQDKKPLLISKLAVSHYSKKGHTFYIEEARDIINHIYSELPKNYPRIKMINYVDIDNIKIAPNDIGSDNFAISTEPKMTKIYRQAISNPYYLESMEAVEEKFTNHWVKLRTPIYEWNNNFYIPKEMVQYDWDIGIINQIKEFKQVIDGDEYYRLDDIAQKLNYKYILDKDILKIYPVKNRAYYR